MSCGFDPRCRCPVKCIAKILMNVKPPTKQTARSLLYLARMFLFSLLAVFQVEATTLYIGKSSDVFKDNSSEFSDTKVLKSIVAEAREKHIQQMGVFLMSGTTLPVGEYEALGSSRFKAVKKYFEKQLPGVVVAGQGQSLKQPPANSPSTEGALIPMSFGMPDVFRVEGERVKGAERQGDPETDVAEPAEPLEEWQQVLLARYRKVEEAHRSLCEIERPDPQDYGEECDFSTQSEKDHEMCLLRGSLFSARERQIVARYEYDLERMLQLRKTIKEVAAIAEEMVQRTRHPRASNNPISGLDREIESQKLAIKYMERAVEKIYLGLKAVGVMEDTPENKSTIDGLANVYHNWFTLDECYATVYSIKTRKKNINQVSALHNFVRVNLGLHKVEDNRFFPICVFTNADLTYFFKSIEEIDRDYEELVAPKLLEYGLEEIPLK